MTIQFDCPYCQKVLTAPDEKAGHLAKCPQCGEKISVPVPESTFAAEEFDDFFNEFALEKSTPKSVDCPLCGAANSESAAECIACGEIIKKSKLPLNEALPIRVGQVYSRSWELYWQNWRACLVAPLLANFLSLCLGGLLLLLFFLVYLGLAAFLQANPLLLVAILVFLGVVISAGVLAVVSYFELGKVILLLKVALDEEPGIGELFTGSPYIGRMILCTLLFEFVLFIANLVFTLLGFLVNLLFWPYPFLLVDHKLPGVQAFTSSVNITQRNLLTLFLLVISMFGIVLLGIVASGGLGFILIGVLNLPAEPVFGFGIVVGIAGAVFCYTFQLLLKAVAYAEMTHVR